MLSLIAAFLVSLSVNADTLSASIQAPDLKVKGSFTFKPGSAVQIIGTDANNHRYQASFESKLQKDDILGITCMIRRNGDRPSVHLVIKKGAPASISSGTKPEAPDLKCDVTWE